MNKIGDEMFVLVYIFCAAIMIGIFELIAFTYAYISTSIEIKDSIKREDERKKEFSDDD